MGKCSLAILPALPSFLGLTLNQSAAFREICRAVGAGIMVCRWEEGVMGTECPKVVIGSSWLPGLWSDHRLDSALFPTLLPHPFAPTP